MRYNLCKEDNNMNITFEEIIYDIAKNDTHTNDTAYNRGRSKILSTGYTYCSTDSDVKYYIMCNGY